MIDHQRTTDNMRSFLSAGGPVSEDALLDTAGEYADACEGVNERLRKCCRLLRDGLRAEAIQQCESEPNLLNEVAALDIPELAAWNQLLSSQGIATAAGVQVELASDLNEAYAQEQPLQAIMRVHRLQALRRSPLRDRIATLRKLAALDSANPVWNDDRRIYERARHQELRHAADAESRQGNVAALELLARDAQNPDWLEPPPPPLVKQILDIHARTAHAHARRELEQLEPELNEAFGQFDAARGLQLRERWDHAAEICGLTTDDALYERAAPALDWLDEQARQSADETGYHFAISSLERALDDDLKAHQLERFAHAVLRFERPIPPLIEHRLRSRMGSLELAHSRKTRLIVGAAIGIILLTAAGIAYAVYRQREGSQIAAHAVSLQALMASGQLDEAQQHLAELAASAPSIAASAEIQRHKVDLAGKVAAEKKREADFSVSIEVAEAAGATEPDRTALENARTLARLDAEKARVLRLETQVASVDQERQGKLDDAFISELKDLRARVDALDADNPDQQTLAGLRQAIFKLVEANSKVSESILEQAKIPQARIDRIYSGLRMQEAATSALKDIDRAVGEPEAFAQALEQFVEKQPEAPQSQDFRRVAGEAAIWKQIASWNALSDQWSNEDVSRALPVRAKELLESCNALLKAQGSHPDVGELKRRIAHLEAIARRGGAAGEKLHAPLNELFTDPMIAGLWMVETRNDKGEVTRYYLISPPPQPGAGQASIQVAYITNFSRSADKQARVRVNEIVYSGEAPQSIVAKKAMDELVRIEDQLWEASFGRILTSIAANEKLDPILKAYLLRKVLDVACQGSELFATAFRQYRAVLESVTIDPAVPWMDPKDEDTRRMQVLAIDMLGRLPPLLTSKGNPGALDQAVENLKVFKSRFSPECRWVGWLSLGSDQTWQCRAELPSARETELHIAQGSGGASGFNWAKVGEMRAGNVAFVPSNATALVRGRPVFAFPQSTADPRAKPSGKQP